MKASFDAAGPSCLNFRLLHMHEPISYSQMIPNGFDNTRMLAWRGCKLASPEAKYWFAEHQLAASFTWEGKYQAWCKYGRMILPGP